MIYASETWFHVKHHFDDMGWTEEEEHKISSLPNPLDWLSERGLVHLTVSREGGEINGYVLSILSEFSPLIAEYIGAKNPTPELLQHDKLELMRRGVAKIHRHDQVLFTN